MYSLFLPHVRYLLVKVFEAHVENCSLASEKINAEAPRSALRFQDMLGYSPQKTPQILAKS